MSTARAFRLGSIVLLPAFLAPGCFDSDQVILPAQPATSTTGGTSAGSGTTRVTTAASSSSGAPPPTTCRDTLACTALCVFQMSGQGQSQLDLIFSCLLECEPPTVAEAVDVFNLIECVTADCIDRGQCDALVPDAGTSSSSSDGGESSSSSSSSTGGSSSSTGGSSGGSSSTGGSTSGSSSSSSSSSSGSTGDPPVDPAELCTSCLLAGLGDPADLDPQTFGCYEVALACE